TWNHIVAVTDTAISANAFEIGRANSSYTNGKIDDVRLYSRALSPSEISRLYDWAPGPVGWWKLDDRTGTSAFDSSGNGNTGTLTNGPAWTTGKIGQGLLFGGSANLSYVDLGNPTSLKLTGSRTVSAWIYLNAPSGGVDEKIVSKSGGSAG